MKTAPVIIDPEFRSLIPRMAVSISIPFGRRQQRKVSTKPTTRERGCLAAVSALCSIRLTKLQADLLKFFYAKHNQTNPSLSLGLSLGLIKPGDYLRYTSFIFYQRRDIVRDFYGLAPFEKPRDRWGRILEYDKEYAVYRRRYRSAVVAISAAIKRLAVKGLISGRHSFTLTDAGRRAAEMLVKQAA
jgi:hypothetical protein